MTPDINKDIFFTFDMDWACDGVLDFFYNLICRLDINITLNVTHDTPFLDVFKKDERIELGLHPNFNKLLDGIDGPDKNEVIHDIKKLVPDAVTVRSHSLVKSSVITAAFCESEMQFELNSYIPPQQGLCLFPWKFENVLQIPFIFEDDLYFIEKLSFSPGYYLTNDFKMFRVFNFHPIHLYLNCENMDRYQKAKTDFKNIHYLEKLRNTGKGIKDFFEELVSNAFAQGYSFRQIRDFREYKIGGVMRIAVLGRTKVFYNVIDVLERSQNEIVLIGTCKEAEGYKVKASDFEQAAKRRNIPFFCSANINSKETIDLLQSVNADIAVSMNWLTLIGAEAINCFKYGILNAHPGDLPRYRGNACPNWALLNGENKIGVAIHFMNPEKLDDGEIARKEYIKIREDTYLSDIYRELETLIPQMFGRVIADIKNGMLMPQKQQGEALRCYPRKPCDSRIDWDRPCDYISKLVRASGKPFQPAYTYIEERKLNIEQVSILEYAEPCLVKYGQVVMIDKLNDKIGIAAADGVVVVEAGYFEEEPYKKITDIVRSTRTRAGYNVEDEIYKLKREMAVLKRKFNC